MLFIKTNDLRVGMRLARPIYNRNGTLLYERNSTLTAQSIVSIRNFGLIGIYVLEPAEPVPPMSKDDIEFERFQTISVFSLRDELEVIVKRQESKKLYNLANQIVKSYGNLYRKINFIQNIRSRSDYVYKHSINTAVLCALMTHQLDFTYEEQVDVVMAALLHDVHKTWLKEDLVEKEYRTHAPEENKDLNAVKLAIIEGYGILQNYSSVSSNVKKIIAQYHHVALSQEPLEEKDVLRGTKVLRVAEAYDNLTAMKSYTEPTTEVTALRALLANARLYPMEYVVALTDSIHILSPGVCVTLTNMDRGIVISENNRDVLRPVVLSFTTNQIMDLSLKTTFNKIQILDVMKTMDNRFVIDEATVEEFWKGHPKLEELTEENFMEGLAETSDS